VRGWNIADVWEIAADVSAAVRLSFTVTSA
jgi:hypothetical protein